MAGLYLDRGLQMLTRLPFHYPNQDKDAEDDEYKMEVEKRKKCDSKKLKVGLAFFILILVPQIKISPISKLFSAIFGGADHQELISCNRSHFLYDMCSINGPTILDPKLSIVYALSNSTSKPQVEKIRPYPRKWDIYKMAHIKEITLTSGPSSPPCVIKHNVSALLFTVGGYTGNFHTDFNEEFIPLFITMNSMFPGQDRILGIANARDWWIRKYEDLLRSFSKHPIIDLDKETVNHCFPSVNVGLMSIDPKIIFKSKTILNFHSLLQTLYIQDKIKPIVTLPTSRPKLLLAGRQDYLGRKILNRADALQVAKEEGFEVIDFEPKYAMTMREAYDLISSSHAMVGIYGAALTHLLSLRPGSVFVQIIPIGAKWLADMHFGTWARDLGLDYLEYNIKVGESSLIDKYSTDDKMLTDPKGLYGKWGGWTSQSVETYLMDQNVRLDLVRFRRYLKKVYVKAKAFMEKEG